MGTTIYSNMTIAQVRSNVLRSLNYKTEKMTSDVVKNTAKWALQKLTFSDGRIAYIPIWLNIYKSKNEVCQKILGADMGVYRYDCPKDYLELAKAHPLTFADGTQNNYFADWIKKAEAYHEQKNLNVIFGKQYILASTQVALIIREYSKGFYLGYIQGIAYKIKKSDVICSVPQ